MRALILVALFVAQIGVAQAQVGRAVAPALTPVFEAAARGESQGVVRATSGGAGRLSENFATATARTSEREAAARLATQATARTEYTSIRAALPDTRWTAQQGVADRARQKVQQDTWTRQQSERVAQQAQAKAAERTVAEKRAFQEKSAADAKLAQQAHETRVAAETRAAEQASLALRTKEDSIRAAALRADADRLASDRLAASLQREQAQTAERAAAANKLAQEQRMTESKAYDAKLAQSKAADQARAEKLAIDDANRVTAQRSESDRLSSIRLASGKAETDRVFQQQRLAREAQQQQLAHNAKATSGTGEAAYVVTPKGVAIPTNPVELKVNLSKLTEASTNPATSRKFVGTDSLGPLRVRVEKGHPADPNFNGKADPLHTADHLHVDRRANGTTGPWISQEKTGYGWPF